MPKKTLSNRIKAELEFLPTKRVTFFKKLYCGEALWEEYKERWQDMPIDLVLQRMTTKEKKRALVQIERTHVALIKSL